MEILNYTNNNATPNIIQNNQDVTSFGYVSYCNEKYVIMGEYSNELLMFRAKKYWALVLQDTFLLENITDFKFHIKKNSKLNVYNLTCTFKSACGRYAFWRISNDQNPEVKHIIETAHLTSTADNYDLLLNKAPNFTLSSDDSIMADIEDKANNISEILKKIVKKICKIPTNEDKE